MKLYNCESKAEKALKEVELQGLSKREIVNLAQTIKGWWDVSYLTDENIVIDALAQISEELGRRV